MDFGTPCLAACLADGAAPRLPASACWVALSPEALTSSRIAAGQMMLVGISNRPAIPPTASPSPSAANRSPATPLSTSTFGPAPELLAPDPVTGAAPAPRDLWALCGTRLGVPELAGCVAPQPGAYLLPARVWPAPKLPRAAALLSPALRESAGQPPAGAVLLLYRMPPPAAAAAPLTSPAPAASFGGKLGEVFGSGVAAAAGSGSGNAVVVLHLCGEALLQPRVEPSNAGGGGNGFGSEYGSMSTASVTAPSPRTPAPKGSRIVATTTAAATPPGGPPISTPVRTPGGGGAAAADRALVAAGAAGTGLRQWPLETLRQAAEAADEGTRTALVAVARRHLAGRHLLPGAPVVLPVLGSSVVFRVVFAAPPAPPYSSCTSVEVERTTSFVVLYPGEAVPEEYGGLMTEAARGTATGTGNGGVITGGFRSTAALVAAARDAAAAAVADSAAAAAADAAERALRAGLASGGLDFSHLGGVGPNLGALRELVTLPLRAPHLFQQYGIRPPRGVLLYGPPGSGKTVLARAAAADAGATLFVINGPDIVSEYYGESEASLRGIFAAATALAPSLLFLDEVDALAPARGGSGGASAHSAAAGGGGGGSDVASRLVTALLTLLDGAAEGTEQHRVNHKNDKSGLESSSTITPGTMPSTTTEHHQQQQQTLPSLPSQPALSSPAAPAPASRPRPIVVIAATNRPDALDAALRRPGRLEREIEVGVPGAAARAEILTARLRSVRHNLTPAQVTSLADGVHGFVSADLAALVDEAAMCALRRLVVGGAGRRSGGGEQEELEGEVAVVALEDFKAAEIRVRPSALREVAVDVPRVRWSDVGGMEGVKAALREAVEWPHKPEVASAMSRLGAVPPRGVLLYGPPGCSKTLLARAVAAEAGLNFMSVKGGELVSKYVGQSEKAIAALFARARATAPSIIFFDELDGLVGDRGGPGGGGGGSGDVSERVLSQLLMEMDGLMDRGGVTVLAATNRPDRLDAALLRPGRFDRLIHVPLPDERARSEILAVHLRRCPVARDVSSAALAATTPGFSGADVAALVREAGLAALEEDIGAERVAQRHFQSALTVVHPSVPPSDHMAQVFARMQRCGL